MSSVEIFEDQENRNPPVRRGKNVGPNFNSQVNRRPVLGTISSNTVRVQPARVAKLNVNYDASASSESGENATKQKSFLSGSSIPSFSIHEDTSSSSATSSIKKRSTQRRKECRESLILQDSSDIHPSVTGFHRTEDEIASSCLMDMSMCDDDLMVLESAMPDDASYARDDDLFDIPEYSADIYKYLLEAEICHKPRTNYMAKQTDISANMRWILVDWLVEVAEEYNLHTETLYLAVSYIDRFLSQMSVKRDKLQLVGTTAMFIAAKYEEIYPPDVGQFAYITDNTYKVSQILRMEHLILKVLSFDMAVPTAHMFVNKFTRMCRINDETAHLALFVAELSMLDCDPFLRFMPSVIAAAAVSLANHTQGLTSWPQHMVEATSYSLEDLKECYVNLHRVFSLAHEPKQHAIRDKYKAGKWNGVSMLSPRQGFPW